MANRRIHRFSKCRIAQTCPKRRGGCSDRLLLLGLIALFLQTPEPKAEISLELIATLEVDTTVSKMGAFSPIGDFNADGWPDVAMGFFFRGPESHEAVNVYFGGPQFDTVSDLVFVGEPQNQNGYCVGPDNSRTYFGNSVITQLNDFNGDGYDDFAISAPEYCPDVFKEGRIYIYFGSPDPDTSVDLEIDGNEFHEYLGYRMSAGDVNGDGYGDLIALSERYLYEDSTRVYAYYGGNPPDAQFDWFHNYTNFIIQYWNQNGYDLNNDNYDDFSIRITGTGNPIIDIYLGSENLGENPDYVIDTWLYFLDDVSGDGIDDALVFQDSANYLCLGGNPLDFEPDYYVSSTYTPVIAYTMENSERKLIMNDWRLQQLIMYNTGVPFDTIPIGYFDYGYSVGPFRYNLGDINADGVEDFAFILDADNEGNRFVNIYSFFTEVSLSDDNYKPQVGSGIICYPNPFNSSMTITLTGLGSESDEIVDIRIYDILGRVIRNFEMDGAGSIANRIVWDGRDDSGFPVANGIYFVTCNGSDDVISAKAMLLK